MSPEELRRLDVVRRLEARTLTTKEAGEVLGMSGRQVRRLRRVVEKEGARGLAHKSRGRPSPRRTKAATAKRVVSLMRTLYAGFNDQHFTEKLTLEGIVLSRSTVRRLLRGAGIGAARKRRPPRHRSRRDRRSRAGLMIVWDGSRHAWLEDRGPMLCLMGAVDDATSELLPGAHFLDQECAAGYLRVLLAISEEKGLPLSAYGDRHGSLKRNDDSWTLEEEMRGEQDPTQVGRALRSLGIERIDALSPQAKGRVERLWGTLQDRLVSELRLAKARTVVQANAVLERFRHEHNQRFAVAPAQQESAWRPVRQGVDLHRICAFDYSPTVLNDNTVRISGHVIDIPTGPGNRGYARTRVQAVQMLDGSWRVYKGDTLIATKGTTTLKEPRAIKRRKRSAISRAFRQAVLAL